VKLAPRLRRAVASARGALAVHAGELQMRAQLELAADVRKLARHLTLTARLLRPVSRRKAVER